MRVRPRGQARQVTETLRGLGFRSGVTTNCRRIAPTAKSSRSGSRPPRRCLVLWSADAAKSQWVRAEADAAREAGTLVQVTDGRLHSSLPFNQIQCADLSNWAGEPSQGWQKVEASLALLVGPSGRLTARRGAGGSAPSPSRKLSVCVLPFVNMSGDAEQEYFSDGISEDIITDLSKISALSVVARNTAFTYKGKSSTSRKSRSELGVTPRPRRQRPQGRQARADHRAS